MGIGLTPNRATDTVCGVADAPRERPLPSLRSEPQGSPDHGPSATVVQPPSKQALASLKEEGWAKDAPTMTLGAEDFLAEGRGNTAVVKPALPSVDAREPFQGQTEILVAPLLLPTAPPLPADLVAGSGSGGIEREREPSLEPPARIRQVTTPSADLQVARKSDRGNLPLIVLAVVLFLIAGAIVIGSLTHR